MFYFSLDFGFPLPVRLLVGSQMIQRTTYFCCSIANLNMFGNILNVHSSGFQCFSQKSASILFHLLNISEMDKTFETKIPNMDLKCTLLQDNNGSLELTMNP